MKKSLPLPEVVDMNKKLKILSRLLAFALAFTPVLCLPPTSGSSASAGTFRWMS